MDTDKYCRDLRDELARDRTVLANERTLLAYVRTALMLLASGMTLVKILRVDQGLRIAGYVLIPLSILVGVMGDVRYLRMRRELRGIGSDREHRKS
jgi:putative membrane protein